MANHLGLSNEDYANMKMVLDDLIEAVVTFNNELTPVSQNDWAEFLAALDFSKYVVSGIVYQNGFDIGCDHDDDRDSDVEYDDEEDDEDAVE